MRQGALKPAGYRPRINDRLLSELLDIFSAVEVAGTMWCERKSTPAPSQEVLY